LTTLEHLLTEQEGGKDGKLLNNGFANLFYTRSCVVDVHWNTDVREWVVFTWKRDGGRWNAGPRAFTVTETSKTSLDEFFQTRSRFFVSDGFRNLVVAKATGTAIVADTKHFDLPRNMSDSEIEEKLGDGHIWEENVLLTTLEHLLTEQEGGKDGKLLNNGFANLFYTRSCVVYVYWNTDDRRWVIFTWKRDDLRWDAGYRAFSPAT